MRLNRCLVLCHKWMPAEETNEAGLRLACTRCGKVRSFGVERAQLDAQANLALILGKGRGG